MFFRERVGNFHKDCACSGAAGKRTFEANPDTMRLYDDLLANYNRLIRPVINNTETLTVLLGLKLSQLIEMVNKMKRRILLHFELLYR